MSVDSFPFVIGLILMCADHDVCMLTKAMAIYSSEWEW